MISIDYFEKMGLRVTWKLIAAGINGIDDIPPQMSWAGVTDYLLKTIGDSLEELPNAFDVYLEKDNYEYANSMIINLAEKENSSISLQKTKIIIALLYNFIHRSSIYEETNDIIGLELEFLEILKIISPNHINNDLLPLSINKQEIRGYFTWNNFYKQKKICKEWIETTIERIKKIEES